MMTRGGGAARWLQGRVWECGRVRNGRGYMRGLHRGWAGLDQRQSGASERQRGGCRSGCGAELEDRAGRQWAGLVARMDRGRAGPGGAVARWLP
ncbi:hypothetical protein chiPu_0031702, partial [Chiloscyllium punctatum]|nr:hypothetical protein [Chiloscyllium punctatum]